MQWQVATEKTDDLLLPFLMANDEAESNRLLDELVTEHARPLIRQIIKSKFNVYTDYTNNIREAQDVEDVVGEVVLHLVKRLRRLKSDPDSRAMGSFRSYVAVTSYNAFYTYLRQKNPQRWRLKNRLRYVLSHQKGFAIWEGGNSEWLCGFAAWKDQGKGTCPPGRLRQLLGSSQDLERAGLSHSRSLSGSPAQMLAAIFNWAGAPVNFDFMVSIIADLWSISDREPRPPDDLEYHPLRDLDASAETRVERRLYLQQLWREICELPLGQRRALLLNLRDAKGLDMTTLLVDARVATVRQIAEALDVAAEEFARMWNDMPMDDATIAHRFGVTRQRIINLRQAARKRLARRMSRLGQKHGA
jgi:RNA polymerase sigma factor (sigma-70 family)